jgi:hypothetical protein
MERGSKSCASPLSVAERGFRGEVGSYSSFNLGRIDMKNIW